MTSERVRRNKAIISQWLPRARRHWIACQVLIASAPALAHHITNSSAFSHQARLVLMLQFGLDRTEADLEKPDYSIADVTRALAFRCLYEMQVKEFHKYITPATIKATWVRVP